MAAYHEREIGEKEKTLVKLSRGFAAVAVDTGGGMIALRLNLRKKYAPKLLIGTHLASEINGYAGDHRIFLDDERDKEKFPDGPGIFTLSLYTDIIGELNLGDTLIDYAYKDSKLSLTVRSAIKPWVRQVKSTAGVANVASFYKGGFKFGS